MARARRRNEKALTALRAAGVALMTIVGLSAMSVRPAWLAVAVGALVGAIALASAELAVLVAVIALSVPLIAVQPVVGFATVIVLVACVHFLGAGGARGFLIMGLSLLGAFLGPVWAGAALAGFLLGAGEGAVAAALACLLIEATGIVLGRPAIGATITGGPADALVSFARMPETLLSAKWITSSMASLDSDAVSATIAGVSALKQPLMLLLQPFLWALGAIAAGTVQDNARRRRSLPLSLVAVSAGVAVPALGGALLAVALDLAVPWGWIGLGLASSAIVSAVFVVVWDRAFPVLRAAPKPATARKGSMATEDADVDELLRLIATAEDRLASDHTSVRVVMITDMKAFSRMTEEDGSVATAKAIQRHRDLLLPIVQQHHGSGKSTGGDGLVSAFESPTDALLAAVDMQRALDAHNRSHPDEREIWVRAGLAAGEVVLDKSGRPFIGAALNLAARVMNLADGGQVFATAGVAEKADTVGVPTHSFGEFELKNIARPVEIVEILWDADQLPRDPRDTGAALDAADDE